MNTPLCPCNKCIVLPACKTSCKKLNTYTKINFLICESLTILACGFIVVFVIYLADTKF